MGAAHRHSILVVLACLAACAGGSHAATPMVAGGDRHSVALHADGTLRTWGSDTTGQLGTRPLYRTTPMPVVGLDQATQVAAGRSHGLARRSDGTVAAWGYNAPGSLGDGTFTTRVRATPALIDQVALVSPGAHQSFAIRADGTLWAWGTNAAGQLGDGTTTQRPTPVVVPGMNAVLGVSSAFSHTIAVKQDGTVWTWGTNDRGELGTGAGPGRSTPAQVTGVTGVIAVATGVIGQFSAALKSDGTVWTWGANGVGQLGDGTLVDRFLPVQVTGLTGVTAIGAGRQHMIALRNDGTVWAWGINSAGQLGDGTMVSPRPTAAPVPGLTGVIRIAAGRGHNLVQLSDGSVRAWGANEYGGVGDGTLVNRNTPQTIAGLGVVVGIAAGDGQSYALKPDGTALSWGGNLFNALGDGNPITRTVPKVATSLTGVTAVSAGQWTTMALRSDGSVWMWGINISGELGDGTFVARSNAAPVQGLPTIAKIADGNGFSLAQGADGSVWSWGFNDRGQLGDGTTNSRPVTQQVAGIAAKAIAAGDRHSAAVATDGTVWTWGYNEFGQLGDGTIIDRTTPVQVPGLTSFDAVATGRWHTLALRSDGTVWAWGRNGFGSLGDNSTTLRKSPVQVGGLAGVIAIAAGHERSMALKSDGTVWTWGSGLLGDGTTSHSLVPKQVVALANVVAIACGNYHMLATLGDGSLRVWGENLNGQVGDGTYVNRTTRVVTLADDGGGSVDGNDWYLDLLPATPTTIPAADTPATVAVAQAKGEDDQLTLDATVKYKASDTGLPRNIYVLAIVPAEFFGLVKNAPGTKSVRELKARAKAATILAQLTPQGWTDVNGQLIAYAQGVGNAAGSSANILDRINTTLIPGARFCIGYGASADSMLGAQALREVLSLEGASGAASGVPCVLSGVYVAGPPSSMHGSTVVFNATVVGLSPTGSVQLLDGFTNLAPAVAISPVNAAVSSAMVIRNSLGIGMHSISASYSGDAQNPAATTEIPALHEVRAQPQLPGGVHVQISGPASSAAGSEVIFDAVVTGDQPIGSVEFRDGGTPIASVPVVERRATLRISTLAVGGHSITGHYSGDSGNSPGASSALAHVVLAGATATKVTLAPSTSSPKIGTPVVFTAAVTGNSPGGSVLFRDYGSDFSGAVALAGGQAQFTISNLAAGTHAITASYSGDGGNPPVTSATILLDVILELDPAQANSDTDLDGIPNGVELAEGTQPSIRDNDVFANARLFTMQQYRDFLAREGDAGGIAFWTSRIGATSRGQVIESFFGSQEFQGTIAPVARLYFAYFLRIPDYAGLNFWIGYYRAGNSLNSIADFFAASAEFAATYGALGNGDFVNLVYQNVLGRAPDAGGFAFWKNELDTGARSRGQVMLGFSESDEYRGAINAEVFVTMAYGGMLRREPDAGGFNFWVQYMDSGNPGLALIDGFLASAEYHGRFLP